jgi:hypothetical protein
MKKRKKTAAKFVNGSSMPSGNQIKVSRGMNTLEDVTRIDLSRFVIS